MNRGCTEIKHGVINNDCSKTDITNPITGKDMATLFILSEKSDISA